MIKNILPISSITTSFFGGVAALFAPCCIAVLLPSYIGSVFSQKRMIVGMTAVFSAGLLTVFLPVGLGAAFFGSLLDAFHNQIYVLGALFLLFLGAMLFVGKSIAIPWHTSWQPNHKLSFLGIYGLGVFSGFATSCCAPVLAGIVTLSILPGSLLLGGIYATAYVLGMVAPLFVLAWAADKTHITERLWIMRRQIQYRILGVEIQTTPSSLLAAAIFTGMGILILTLVLTGNLAMGR